MIENSPTTSHLYEKERGQSLVEMAFGLIILVIIFSGLVDLGRAYFTLIAMEDAAGEAALFLSVMPGCEEATSLPDPTNPLKCTNTNNAVYRYRNAPGTQLDWDTNGSYRFCRDILSDGTCLPTEANPGPGSQYVIELSYRFDLLTPIIRDIAGDSGITLTVKASQIVITN